MAFRNLLRQNTNQKKWDMASGLQDNRSVALMSRIKPSQKMAYFHSMFKQECMFQFDFFIVMQPEGFRSISQRSV